MLTAVVGHREFRELLMLFRLSMAVALLAGAATSANAVTTLMWSSTADVGKTQTVSFDGLYGASVNHKTVATPLAGLSSTLALTLTKVSGKDWTFDYAVDNTSLAPVAASKVSVFGFDAAGKISGANSTGSFGKSGSGPVPLLGTSADVCFRFSGGRSFFGEAPAWLRGLRRTFGLGFTRWELPAKKAFLPCLTQKEGAKGSVPFRDHALNEVRFTFSEELDRIGCADFLFAKDVGNAAVAGFAVLGRNIADVTLGRLIDLSALLFLGADGAGADRCSTGEIKGRWRIRIIGSTWKNRNQAKRMISTSRLNTLLHFHLKPINVVVSDDPSGKIHLGRSLALRCFQRLSIPYLATRPCP